MTLPRVPVGEWKCDSDQETLELGAQLGRALLPGTCVLLSGPVGAGKTVMAKGIATALGMHADNVTSPSFSLVNYYPTAPRLCHIDLYRIDAGPAAAEAVDLDELMRDEEVVTLIEWAERVAGYPFPIGTVRVQICGDGDEERLVTITQD